MKLDVQMTADEALERRISDALMRSLVGVLYNAEGLAKAQAAVTAALDQFEADFLEDLP
jgi:hypothetical protein